MNALASGDALEVRDLWREVWRPLTNNGLLVLVLGVTGVGALSLLLLPQTPPDATADPIAYSRWEALARQYGALFEIVNALGLTNIARAAWWHVALGLGIALSALRLLGLLGDAVFARREADPRLDEERLQVIYDAPPTAALAHALHAQRLKVEQQGETTLIASPPSQAVLASATLYAGLVALFVGLIIQAGWGWSLYERRLIPDAPLLLPDRRALVLDESGQVTLASRQPVSLPGSGTATTLDGVSLLVRQRLSGYRVSAERANVPLKLYRSSFGPAQPEIRVLFSEVDPEHFLAAPDGAVAVVLRAPRADDQPLVEVFALPTGELLLQTQIQPEIQVGDVRLRFAPTIGAVVDASYQPGILPLALGSALAALGLVGVLVLPSRRLIVQRHEHWLECYARGRGARTLWLNAVRAARAAQEQSQPNPTQDESADKS
ncbi:MAG: hypothetical protein NZ693_08005 [Thermoflexales bacterium]|nr:hypothetical protein [Thermoflexales bacterium]